MGSFDEFAQPVIDDLNSRLTETTTLLARERDAFGQRETELMGQLKGMTELASAKIKGPFNSIKIITALRSENAALQARLDRLIKLGNNVEDILEVPQFLGAHSTEVCQKAIDDFRKELRSLSPAPSAKEEGKL